MMAEIVPRNVAIEADMKAIFKLLAMLSIKYGFLNSSAYHFSENPSQIPGLREALNEQKTRNKTGM